MSFGPGSTIGSFKIQSLLGKGGMGEVFSAIDTKLGRNVAIKVLPKGVASDPERLCRFEQETRMLASLNHPNILTIYDAGVHEGTPYLLSELLEGQTLREVLTRGEGGLRPTRKVVDYALQIAHGLAAAHAKGIIHRDLKPENVFITKEGRVKILDFGIAKLSGPLRLPLGTGDNSPTVLETTVAGVVLGTPAYMSPEQVRGEPADHRSDIFSFGCVLYEMLGAKNPFRRDTPSESMAAILREDCPRVNRPDVPPALEQIVEHCLEKQPQLRFQTVQDLAFALQTVNGTSTDRLSPSSQPPKRSVPSAGALLLLGSVVFAALGGFFFWRSQNSAVARGSSASPHSGSAAQVRKFEIFLPDQTAQRIAPEILEIHLSDDGRQIAYSDNSGLWLKWLDRLGPPTLISSNSRAASPFWSPDGAVIGWFEDNRMLRKPVAGGQVQTITLLDSPATQTYGGAVWLKDGRIAFSNADGPLYSVPPTGGPREVLVPLRSNESDFHRPYTVAPNTSFVFNVHGKATNLVAYWDAKVGRKDLYVLPGLQVESVGYAYGHLLYSTEDVWAVPLSLEKFAPTGHPFRIFDGCRLFTVAGDGTIGFTTCELEEVQTRQLVWVSREGKLLETVGSPERGLYEPQLLAGDGKILYVANDASDTSQVWLLDPARKFKTHKTPAHPSSRAIRWDQNRGRFFYARGLNPTTQIVSEPLEAGGPEQVIGDGMIFDLAPEADLLLSLPVPASDAHLTVSSLSAATPPVVLTNLPSGNLWIVALTQPRLAPNGKALACVLSETGQDEIYSVALPSGAIGEQISHGGGQLPMWRADGRELFYLAANGRTMMSVSVDWNPDPHFGEPMELFHLPDTVVAGLRDHVPSGDYTVSNDGKRFLMMERHGDATRNRAFTPALYLVQNWFSEYKNASAGR